MQTEIEMDKKHETEHDDLERAPTGKGEMEEERIELSEEDDRRIRRKTDRRILAVLCWIYFLQIFDKVVFGLGNVFGLSEDLKLTGTQYSFAGSIHAIAQLAWQPFSSYLIVRIPSRPLMTFLVFAWGVSEACMAASLDYRGIYVTRFFLGLFEAGCLPLFSIITAQWYRRSEQPLRVAAWYGTNGIATIFASILAYGLGHINSENFKAWQALYLVAGILTVASAPIVWFFLDSDIETCRFLTETEKKMAYERLRANQTGTGTREWKWDQVIEVFVDPKSYIWLGIVMLPNIGAAVTNVFGPTLIKGFGYDKYVTTLLSMPFGALQTIAILFGCYCAAKLRIKSAILAGLMVLVVAGCAMIYVESISNDFTASVALGGYYLMAFLFGGNPLIVSWIVANTAGQTKKSVIMAFFNAASAAGNIIGPLLFKAEDKESHYSPGVRSVLGIFIALVGLIGIQVIVLWMFNKQRQRQRVAAGKPAHIHDTSMESKYQAYGKDEAGASVGTAGLNDVTDVKNNEFVYVY